MQSRPAPRVLVAFFAAFLGLTVPVSAEEYDGPTPPRLSLVEGQVSYWRAGASEWEPAQVNLPISPGDFVYTGPSSRVEMQIGARAFVRAGEDSQLGVDAQEGGLIRFDLAQGRAALDVRDLSSGAHLEVLTPHGKLQVQHPGLYDITVDDARAAFSALQGGRATVVTTGETRELATGSEIIASAGSTKLARLDAPPPDDFDRWNSERTDRLLLSTSSNYVSQDIYGARDLDDYGTWRNDPKYGQVWVPSNVAPDWAPYTTGRWVWGGDYGWSWVDTAPWGWAPYHYGRWVYANNYWGWAPGPIVVAPAYSPALVAFYGGPSVSVSVGFGFPYVSWVALGWGEPVWPWWGPTWYRSAPCWYGWGGPTIINNVYYNYGNRYGRGHGWGHGNWQQPKHYANERARNAMVTVRRDDFGRRNFQRQNVDRNERSQMRPRQGMPIEAREAGVQQTRTRTRPTRPDRVDVARGSAPGAPGSALNDKRRPDRAGAVGESGSRTDPRANRRAALENMDRARPERPMTSRQLSERPMPQRNGDTVGNEPQGRAVERPQAPRERSDFARRPDRPDRPLPSSERRDSVMRGRVPSSPNSVPGSSLASSRPDRPQRPFSPGQGVESSRPSVNPRAQGSLPERSRPQPPTMRERPQRNSAPVQDAYNAPQMQRFQPRRETGRIDAPRVEQPQVMQPQMASPQAREPQMRPQMQARPQYNAPQSNSPQMQAPQMRQPQMQASQPSSNAPRMRSGTDFGSRGGGGGGSRGDGGGGGGRPMRMGGGGHSNR